MNEMFNAATSLLPLLAVKNENGHYINASITAFSFVATLNHMFAENLSGTTHLVKLLVTNILFSILEVNPILGIIISLLDLTPLIATNKFYSDLGELIIQIPRQIIDIYLIYYIYNEKHLVERTVFILIAKVIYFIERRMRIKKKDRNNFYLLHSFEHFGMHILICSMLDANPYDIISYLKIFLGFMCVWSFIIFFYTFYLYRNHLNRAPAWLKQDEQLKGILKRKLEKNLYKGKIHNYICKPWTFHLKMEIITWSMCERNCEELLKQIDPSDFDCVVGISTGGAFIGAYMGKLLKKPYYIIHSKLWSGTNFLENSKKAIGFFLGQDINPEIDGFPEIKGKTILLCDDTSYTGVTMKKCKKYCEETLQVKLVKTLNFWIYDRFVPDYYLKSKRVPIFWEWGAEMD